MDFSYTWIFVLMAVVALGWIVYGIWLYKERKEEEKMPEEEKKTEHLKKVKSSFEDYAKKMAEYKLKPHERKEKDPHEWS